MLHIFNFSKKARFIFSVFILNFALWFGFAISDGKNSKNIAATVISNKIDNLKNMPITEISPPISDNVVILNPGHGFEDDGATVINTNTAENKANDTKDNKNVTNQNPQELVREKVLNAKTVYDLTLKLLNLKFDVYLIYDLKNFGLELPKNNPQLHILFENKPPVDKKLKIVEISAYYIKEIIKKIKNVNNKAKTVSVCIHHNHCGNGNPNSFGFISFYRNDEFVSQNFSNNSKILSEMFLKHCKNIYGATQGSNCSTVNSSKKWLVCSFGSNNEKNEKLYDSEAAVLLELGFMTNPEELKKILNDENRNKMADALSNALCEYYKINSQEH